jgi:hypothetical protein
MLRGGGKGNLRETGEGREKKKREQTARNRHCNHGEEAEGYVSRLVVAYSTKSDGEAREEVNKYRSRKRTVTWRCRLAVGRCFANREGEPPDQRRVLSVVRERRGRKAARVELQGRERVSSRGEEGGEERKRTETAQRLT